MLFWSRHKHMYSIQFLAVIIPASIISCIFGLYEERRNDWRMWKEGIQEIVVKNISYSNKDKVYLYSDKVFYLDNRVIGAYKQNNRTELTLKELIFNIYMVK
ncbi:hypothetical protein L873DRAFT_1686975 [Choiromyces venosus 120613-1]|uniref:Uncharacterized protein n=1 Tax=Choiromyces venosus 120613-1 TaxID=1336337 RepID=A0A3N4JK40_9PEZI|nr:hypothetical protein L873DRAFT_1686975 [Choiromyces venosus 120613-1]